MPNITWRQTAGIWWPVQKQDGTCGYYSCAIIAALLKPELSRFRISVKLARRRVWANKIQLRDCLTNDFGIRCMAGGNEFDHADTTALEGRITGMTKRKPIIASAVGPFQGQNHWVVIAQRRGAHVLVIDPAAGPIWGDIDGYIPNQKHRNINAFFAGPFVAVL